MQASGAVGRRYPPGECRGRARPFRRLEVPLRAFLCPYQLSIPFWYKTQKPSDITEPARRFLGTPELVPRPHIALVVPAGGWDAPMARGGGWECAVWLGATSVFWYQKRMSPSYEITFVRLLARLHGETTRRALNSN